MPAEALRFSEADTVPAGPGTAPRAPLGPELEQALQSMSAERHADTARRITDLFVAGANQFNPQHVGLFDRTLGHLIGVLPADVLASVAQRLAPVRNAPPDVMRRLAANPAIAVAGPVLARSNLLDDADLVAIASAGSQAHLFAISGRPRLGTPVTRRLVDCGDRATWCATSP